MQGLSKWTPKFHLIRDGFVGNWAAVDLWKRSFTAALESSERHPGASSVQSSDSEPNILTLRCHQVWIWTYRILPRKPSDLCSSSNASAAMGLGVSADCGTPGVQSCLITAPRRRYSWSQDFLWGHCHFFLIMIVKQTLGFRRWSIHPTPATT